MPPSRLTEVDKHDILNLYQRGQETTTTLASRYGVSNSTVIRVLKSFLSSDEYESLVQSKRSNGREKLTSTSSPTSITDLPLTDHPNSDHPNSEDEPAPAKPAKATSKSRSPRSRKDSPTNTPEAHPSDNTDQLSLLNLEPEAQAPPTEPQAPPTETPVLRPKLSVKANPGKDLANGLSVVETEIMSELRHSVTKNADADADDEDEELDDDFDEDDFDDDGLDVDGTDQSDLSVLSATNLEVLPLTEGSLPHTCYIVIDRTAELVTRPLKDFGALGKVPDQAEHDRILPIFDNHRIAKRFSNRNQRIIKVPDGRMLSKASPQLQAKGITRLLIDGRVYNLTD
jgi:hypothetical protein